MNDHEREEASDTKTCGSAALKHLHQQRWSFIGVQSVSLKTVTLKHLGTFAQVIFNIVNLFKISLH